MASACSRTRPRRCSLGRRRMVSSSGSSSSRAASTSPPEAQTPALTEPEIVLVPEKKGQADVLGRPAEPDPRPRSREVDPTERTSWARATPSPSSPRSLRRCRPLAMARRDERHHERRQHQARPGDPASERGSRPDATSGPRGHARARSDAEVRRPIGRLVARIARRELAGSPAGGRSPSSTRPRLSQLGDPARSGARSSGPLRRPSMF